MTRYSALFDEVYPAVRRYVHHRGARGADADDIVADVMLIAWRRLDVVPLDDPIPWMFAVARNVWRNHRRGTYRRERLLRSLPAPEVELPVEPTDDDGAADIRRALDRLGDSDRELLILVAWDGLTSEQLAVTLGCTVGAARVRLHRARTRLANELASVTPTPRRTELLDARTPEGGSE